MSKVYGTITLSVLVNVDSDSEDLGLLQANYKINPDRFIGWILKGITCNNETKKINVCDCLDVKLHEFLE